MSHGVFFGSNVREARELAGWTRADFIRRLKASGVPMHATTLARIEEGKQVAKIPEALAMASLLGTTVEVLGNVDSFAPQKEIKAAELAVKKKRDAVLHAWEEWIIAGEDLLSALLNNGYKLDKENQEIFAHNYGDLTGLEEIFHDLGSTEFKSHYRPELGDTYVESYMRYRKEAEAEKEAAQSSVEGEEQP